MSDDEILAAFLRFHEVFWEGSVEPPEAKPGEGWDNGSVVRTKQADGSWNPPLEEDRQP